MSVTRQSFRDISSGGATAWLAAIGEDTSVPKEQRRGAVADLIGDRALSARSVLASALLGADQPQLSVAELVGVASLFGISGGAARTCLWRMVSNGELSSEESIYALAGHLLERRERVDEASRIPDVATRLWDGTWELAVVSAERRPPSERLELRKAATALHLAELREGVWLRPDNLDPQRLPTMRGVLDRQCVHFHGAASSIADHTVRSLFSLDDWACDANRLTDAMQAELDATPIEQDDTSASFRFKFALSIAVVRHLQLDPLLPAPFIPEDWPGNQLRDTYRNFDEAFKHRMYNAFR